MRLRSWLVFSSSVLAGSLLWAVRTAGAQTPPLVRIAELEIDPAQLEQYRAALKTEIERSIQLEPGVLALYAVAVRDHADQIRLFEMYSDEAAYQAHLGSPHFKRYKRETAGMVKSLRLIETDPILLGSKQR